MRRVLLFTIFTLFAAANAHADGLIVIANPPTPVPGHFTFAPLQVTYHHVTVSIDNGVAVTAVDQEFYNPNPQRLEGTYLFPLPEGASVDKFSMDVDGKMATAELLSAEKARAIYKDIVRKQRDPGLLEYAGRGAFTVRIFPIEPNGRKHIKLQYTQLIRPDNGVSEYAYSLNTEKFSSRPLDSVSVTVNLNTSAPIKNVYSPSHAVEVHRTDATHAVVGYEQRSVRPDTDFELIWSQDKDPVGLNLLSWQTGTADGYFVLMASPGINVDAKAVQPRDLCFVLDTSGSMAGAKLEQAKKALLFCLANLNSGDRFEIVRFSTETEPLFGALVDATADNVAKATAFIKDLKPIGGTAIQDALKAATRLFATTTDHAHSRPSTIIFLTDGQPTVGETREDNLVDSVAEGPTRVFCFGIGTDINTHLLDRIAARTHAGSEYVLPEEDIELKVSSFFAKIKSPTMSNIALSFDGDVKVSQQYPHDLPDLFKGETLTIFGRYTGAGHATATISGTVDGRRQEFSADVNFVKENVSHQFIPRLWATRRVGWLLDEIRLHGESKELKDEIVQLAREHGIVTPYTSYLILEDEQRRNVPLSMQTQRELGADRSAASVAKATYDSARFDSPSLEKDGRRAVANSANADSLSQAQSMQQSVQGYALSKSAFFAGATPSTQPVGYRIAQNYAQQTRVVNGRAFYQNGNVWTDARAQDAGLRKQSLAFDSEPYFALLQQHPDAAAWLSLGDEVDVVLDGTVYSIRSETNHP